VRKRILGLIVVAAAIALLIAGVAAAAGGLAPSGDVPSSSPSSLAPETQGSDETTTESTGLVTEPTDLTTDTTAELHDTDAGPATTESAGEAPPESTVRPDNFGRTISSLRHSGDHTPAAVIKGKKVPGYHKKMTTTTESTAAGESTTTTTMPRRARTEASGRP
jgi:hypothetical protein